MIDALRLGAGWALAWLLGVAIVAALAPHRLETGVSLSARSVDSDASGRAGEIMWLAGSGFLAGAFVLTIWMRVLSAAHVRFSIVSIAAPLAIATLALLIFAYVRRKRRTTARELGAPLSNPLRAIWWALAAWVAARFAMLLLEVVRIPLYPWDAWEQWATKARVWYEFGRLVPFVDAGSWFAAHGTAWTDASPGYPATVPLWQVWSCIALGRWDDALMNLPWWLTAVALAFAAYGVVRGFGASALAAMIGAWLVSSLPLANVHVALAGYADLPMAAYYALAALASWRWARSRSIGDATLALVFALACPTTKTPGTVGALTLFRPCSSPCCPGAGRGLSASASPSPPSRCSCLRGSIRRCSAIACTSTSLRPGTGSPTASSCSATGTSSGTRRSPAPSSCGASSR